MEPARIPDGYPLMHIKDRSEDGRLFGERDTFGRQAPALIPHELTHALHFSCLSDAKRGGVSARYFAQAVGLDLAASADFEANALTFGEYRDFIHRTTPQHDAALDTARVFWGL